MKKWSRPQTVVQKFEANEYVAACGDENKVYKLKCDAPTEWGNGLVFVETNGEPGLQYRPLSGGGDTFRSNYHPCGEEHEAPTTDSFLQGYYIFATMSSDEFKKGQKNNPSPPGEGYCK